MLGPTKELADQITRVAKELCHHAKFRATCLSANRPMKLQRDSLAAPIDLVVGTPTRVLQHVDEGSVFFGDVQWLVRGEVCYWWCSCCQSGVARLNNKRQGDPLLVDAAGSSTSYAVACVSCGRLHSALPSCSMLPSS